MHKNRKLWHAALAVSISSALAFPAFVYSQSGTSKPPSSQSAPSSNQGSAETSAHGQKASGTDELSNVKSISSSPKGRAASSEHRQKTRSTTSASRIRNNLAPNEFFTQADRDLIKRVQEDLRGNSALADSVQKLNITAKQGTIVLRGAVKSDQEKTDIAARVRQTMGVEEVENQLQVSSRLSSREEM